MIINSNSFCVYVCAWHNIERKKKKNNNKSILSYWGEKQPQKKTQKWPTIAVLLCVAKYYLSLNYLCESQTVRDTFVSEAHQHTSQPASPFALRGFGLSWFHLFFLLLLLFFCFFVCVVLLLLASTNQFATSRVQKSALYPKNKQYNWYIVHASDPLLWQRSRKLK